MRLIATLLSTALLGLAGTGASAAEAATDRGAYLVQTMGCGDCHSPMVRGPNGMVHDVARGLSGHPEGMTLPPPPAPSGPWVTSGVGTNTAFAGPWGVSYAINLTPDAGTGIGAWKAADFVAAMRTGKHLGVGRRILPPMPWHGLALMTDADLNAIFDFLMRQPAVRNAVPDASPPGR